MNLLTKAEFGENPIKIHHKERILTVGSCFAEHIGQNLIENKFNILCNPFGIMYNPGSISSCLYRLHENSLITAKELQLCQDYNCHPDFHSRFNGIDKYATEKYINTAINDASHFEKEGLDWLLISFGTAFVFKQKRDGRIVNNCHKIPASEFHRELMSIEQIVKLTLEGIHNLRKSHNNLRVILTVSPIRHLRDGLVQNLRSKSRLIEAVHLMCQEDPNLFYFPSYEILNEELRDYRWFKEDMAHPTQQAIQYIWNRFKNFGIHVESLKLIAKMEAIKNNLNHRPFLSSSAQYKKFLDVTAHKIDLMMQTYPEISFDTELSILSSLRSGTKDHQVKT